MLEETLPNLHKYKENMFLVIANVDSKENNP
jgi:hypothetical protein